MVSRGLGLFVAFLLAVQVAPAQAAGPVRDGGRVEIGPGWRLEPAHGSSHFGGQARFSWHIDARLFLGIELGATGGRLSARRLGLDGAEDLRVMVGDLRFAVGAHLLELGPVQLYGALGGGYHLVGITERERYREGATQGLFAGAGALVPVSDRVGIFLENRFTFLTRIRAEVAGTTTTLDVGGNLLWAGVVLFFEPERRPADGLRYATTP